MTSGYERELAELRKALELPIVGHPHCGAELAELRRLIEKYADQARQMVAKVDGRQTVDPCQDRDEMTWGGMRISVNSVGAFGSRRNSLMTAYYEIRHRMFRNSAPGMRGAR